MLFRSVPTTGQRVMVINDDSSIDCFGSSIANAEFHGECKLQEENQPVDIKQEKDMKLALSITAAILVAFSHTSNAANAWYSPLPITSILNNLDGGFLMLLSASDAACGPSGNQFHVDPAVNGQTTDSVKTTLAIVLSAFAMGKTITVYADNAIPGCPVQLVMVNQ